MRRGIALIMALGLALAACSGGSEASTDVTFGDGGKAGGETFNADQAAPGERGSVDVVFDVVDSRQVIRRASLQLHASETRKTFDQIREIVESSGGFVANANVAPVFSDGEQPQISLTLRVPADDLSAILTAVKGVSDEVVSETQTAEDVTEQFVDLEARLTNLEALESELRALLEDVRKQENADPEKLLRVFNEVSSVRGQIEQIQGQLNYLNNRTSLATIDVGITQSPSTAPLVDEPWNPGEAAREAVANLVNGLQGAGDWLINFGLFALPMLILTLGPLVLIGLFIYRRFFRNAGAQSVATGQ